MKPVVMLTQPRGATVTPEARDSFHAATLRPEVQVARYSHNKGIACLNHNDCWAVMLNNREDARLTHFAMIHGDVIAPAGWLDTLLSEMDATGADIVSAVIPLKDPRGLTSTLIENRDTPDGYWGPKRLALAEVYDGRPRTFTDPLILLNTGLWLAKVATPKGPAAWCERVHFHQRDDIVFRRDVGAKGTWIARLMSEDVNFMKMAREAGAKCYATVAVPVVHEFPIYHNRSAWGTWAADRECMEAVEASAASHST